MSETWLAVSDETGNFDQGNRYIGVGMVIARLSDWNGALQEPIGDRSVASILEQPIPIPGQNVPRRGQHHVKDALDFWNRERPRASVWAANGPHLEQPARHLAELFHWLLRHERLITLGVIGRAPDCRRRLGLASRDPAHLLARMTAPLLKLVWPFLARDDRLLVLPSFRSEPTDHEALRRVQVQAQKADDRVQRVGDRPLVSTLLDDVNRTTNYFDVNTERCTAGRIHHLRSRSAALQQSGLKSNQLQPLADIAAALTLLTDPAAHANRNVRIPKPNTGNARFYRITEVTSA